MAELNQSQFEAVSSLEGPYLIIAGAGSGKTRTLVYRVARLVESGYEPSSILLLTFTRKAAREMMSRAELLLDKRCAKIQGGTFHSFANVILRKYAKAAGLGHNFTILDQSDSEDVVNLLRTQLKLGSEAKRFPKKETLFKIYSLAVNTGREIPDIVGDEYPQFVNDLETITFLRDSYTEYKRQNNLLDYDDLIVKLRDFLFDLSPAAKNLLNTINFVMVDEYQDTNKLQSQVVAALTQLRDNIMVVGDDQQSIYAFRGADYKNILQFPDQFPGTRIIKLEENYRSTQSILNFANRVQEAAIFKFDKQLYTQNGSGDVPVIVAAPNDNMQSKFIVNKILELREEGVPLEDMAVLFRSSYFSFDLEIELAKANIPYIKVGGIKFIESAHIKDLLAFLRVALNPTDVVSFYRILLLHGGIGPKSAQKMIDEVTSGKFDLSKSEMINGETTLYKKLPELYEVLYRLHNKKETPVEKAQVALEYYLPLFFENYDDYNKRRKDLDVFINICQKYDTLEEFLTDIAIEPPVDSVTDVEEESDQDEYLTLSTIHSAKGLEWHTVFIINVIDGFFPSVRAFESIETLEEERRLMYVAVTRAKRNLFVTYPIRIFSREEGMTISKLSRFLNNITTDHAEGWLYE
ncbi:MAG: ATP-dependent helicase [Ignavibacteriaceae bacterium]|nr:ATP-dependent helicase [Ignavibacteriaceae bacterium]NUM70258.1 ATP-dependent helicase [Ignavibacteriaceae bacterium]